MTGVGGVGLAVSGLCVVFFIFSSSSQAIVVNVIWSIYGSTWPSNSGSLEASSDGLPRRFRRLFLFLPPWRFLDLLVGPRGKGRSVDGGLGLPFL